MNEPQELSFENVPLNEEELLKLKQIEKLLQNDEDIILNELQSLARSDYGLVDDNFRRKLWPVLAGVDISNLEKTPSLTEMQAHSDYKQVIQDVNRSLKRFPPGIPYDQRIALQDQLTVLILRVIKKYPNLRYYQGYHDVAVTFLLVVGEEVAFAVMEQLSTNHFSECMQDTMDATQKRLMFIWPIINFENRALFQFLQLSSVGTIFALPWYLTWFGHNLKSYKAVVRLYDYFLASPIYSPIYVTAAILLYRAEDIMAEECDMASVHLFLSNLPDDLPFEEILKTSSKLYEKYSLSLIEKEIMRLFKNGQGYLEEYRTVDSIRRGRLNQWLPQMLTHRSVIFTTALSIIVGICTCGFYFYKNQYMSTGVS